MGSISSLPRSLLLALATLYAAATVLYSAIWLYYIRRPAKAEIGIEYSYSAITKSLEILHDVDGGSAQRVGLRHHDRILAINDVRLDKLTPYYDLVTRGRPGDVVRLTVIRSGATLPETVQVVLGPYRTPERLLRMTLVGNVALRILGFYPLAFMIVGLAVLFLRLDDRNAWLLSFLFGGFIASAPLPEGAIHPTLRVFAMSYRGTLSVLAPALFYYFFAVYPAPSLLERRMPWLKHAFFAFAGVLLASVVWTVTVTGSTQVLWLSKGWRHERLLTTLLEASYGVYAFGAMGLGIASLVLNSTRSISVESRRKARVVVWGVVGGLLPSLLLTVVAVASNKRFEDIPVWSWALSVLALLLLPLSFAYAVVKHRVMEIPVLLRRSARYVLVQRGFVLLILGLSAGATLLFAFILSDLFRSGAYVSIPAGVGFGVVLAVAGSRVHQRVTQRIDRAFFRSAYDARQILQDLAEKARTATSRQELAALLGRHIEEALHPTSLAIYLEGKDGRLEAERGEVPPELRSLQSQIPALAELARRGQAWEVSPENLSGDLSSLRILMPECMVPMLGRDGRLLALLILGPRLSEEPYSREDKRLLASVAGQASVTLESIRLAEQMAERLEAERHAAFEMEIAKQVQAKLFPQKLPRLKTLEYAGGCLQARQVGGDYYDFLDLGSGRAALLLADVAGKGISAALLMANLQANLRSQYALALDDLPRLLESVNRLFCESTPSTHYATVFFGVYDDASRRLRYANCGHNPPLLLRSDGSVQRLTATATVLGLFEDWECQTAEVELTPGDCLLIFSDGATEAMSDGGEEFGESRLVEAFVAHRHLPAAAMLESIMAAVRQFTGREQEDDLTLVVARAR